VSSIQASSRNFFKDKEVFEENKQLKFEIFETANVTEEI